MVIDESGRVMVDNVSGLQLCQDLAEEWNVEPLEPSFFIAKVIPLETEER